MDSKHLVLYMIRYEVGNQRQDESEYPQQPFFLHEHGIILHVHEIALP